VTVLHINSVAHMSSDIAQGNLMLQHSWMPGCAVVMLAYQAFMNMSTSTPKRLGPSITLQKGLEGQAAWHT
jgi:hypothetical protein